MKTIYIVGAGKGLGNAVAKLFGEHGFQVVLMSRNQEHLLSFQREFEQLKIPVGIQTVDTSQIESIQNAYQQAIKNYDHPDMIFYNVGITTPDNDQVTSKQLDFHYKTDVIGAYEFIQLAMKDKIFIQNKGTILLTGGGVAINPSAKFLPLSMDKAALRAMAVALNPKLSERNIHLGLVNIFGAIGKSDKYLPDKIAQKYWQLYLNRQSVEINY